MGSSICPGGHLKLTIESVSIESSSGYCSPGIIGIISIIVPFPLIIFLHGGGIKIAETPTGFFIQEYLSPESTSTFPVISRKIDTGFSLNPVFGKFLLVSFNCNSHDGNNISLDTLKFKASTPEIVPNKIDVEFSEFLI